MAESASLSPPAQDLPITLIEPTRGWMPVKLGELWEYRELLYFLTWRDIKVRYKQTALGAAWAIIQPFFSMVVFSLFFGQLAGIPSDGVPYPVFSYAGLFPVGIALSVLGNSIQPNDIEKLAAMQRRSLVRILIYTPDQTISEDKPAALWEHTQLGLKQIY